MTQDQMSPRDARLESALQTCMQEIEAGTPPDREALRARWPDLAEELSGCLQALAFVHRAGSEIRPDQVFHLTDPEPLGDYRIVREVGRGGMGVVYEAEQLSLSRRVALKVLPFAAALDARQQQRFRNEAHAAAQLHHTNIVPVYAVGFERGVHFYAMQFIDGRTLADVIQEMRRLNRPLPPADRETDGAAQSPASSRSVPGAETDHPLAGALSTERSARSPRFFRTVANLGVQAAEALEHAHQAGVIHRDIKPSNLLVDGRGNLWVTDFGLALVAGDAKLTMTGDIVGTLRYMSPEQALGLRTPLDQRTDVYSLGVTLYELLTLEPAFGGDDRKVLLRQIAFDEPKPLRRLNRAIPAELETIVLKAMAKNATERYASAGELAEDLRRFLEDRPIRAKRPGIFLRARKWARRHRPVVWAAAVVVVMALVLGGAAGGWYLQEHAARRMEFVRDVEARYVEANVLAAEAEKLRDKPTQWQATLTGARAALARAETMLAGKEDSTPHELRNRVRELRLVLDAEELDRQLFADIEQFQLQQAEVDHLNNQFRPIDSRQYAEAFARYGIQIGASPPQTAGERIRSRSPAVSTRLVVALDQWLLLATGDDAVWVSQILAVADRDPWRAGLRAAWTRKDRQALKRLAADAMIADQPAQSLNQLGSALWHPSGAQDAPTAIALLERACTRQPADFWLIQRLAYFLTESKPPRLEKAVRYHTAAVALRPDSAGAWVNLGKALRMYQKLDDAVAAHRKAIELQPAYAAAHNDLGVALRELNKLNESIAAFREAIRLKPAYAFAHNNLGIALRDQKKLDEAVAALREAVRLDRTYAAAHSNLGVVLREQGQLDEAVAAYREAIAADPTYASGHFNLAKALTDQKQFAAAVVAYREALKLTPRDAITAFNLGNTLQKLNRFGEAVAAYDQAIRAEPNDARYHRSRATALREQGLFDTALAANREAIRLEPTAAISHFNLGNLLKDRGEYTEAAACFREAIRLQPKYAEAWCNLGHILSRSGEFLEAAEAMRRGHELGQQTPGWSYPSAMWLRQAEQQIELEKRVSSVLSGGEKPGNASQCAAFAMILARKRLNANAVRFFNEAFTAQPDLRTVTTFEATAAAVQAGVGQGKDAITLNETERAKWRRQALDWLRADLATWTKQLESDDPQTRTRGAKMLHQVRFYADFAGVRDAIALAKLPDADRNDWRKFWSDVDQALARAADKDPATEKPKQKSP